MKSSGSSSQQWLLLPTAILALIPGVWNGFACISNPCVHGVCLDDLNSTYFCYCIDGYTGIQCQTNWNECWSSPCRNGGVCIDGIATFTCSCLPGFTGDFCEEDINECESNPCLNNGTCLDAQNGYTCNCLPGYSGVHCEIDVAVCNATNETRCSNGGICEEGPGESFTCRCRPGWGGFLCDAEIDECISAPCQNGAVCIDLHADYSCACLFGFTGRNCEEIMQICDSNPCKNGALCLIEENRTVCYCVPDFHGELCQFQYDECQIGPRCMNGGTCIDGIDNFTCSCPPNLTGVLCECLILADNTLDCTYISPKPITSTSTIFYETTPTITIAPISTSTTTSIQTTESPSTEVLVVTNKTDFFTDTPETTISTMISHETALPYTSTVFTAEPTTFMAIFEGNLTTQTATEYSTPVITPFVSSTDMATFTTESQTSTSEITIKTSETSKSELSSEFSITSTEMIHETEISASYPTGTSPSTELITSIPTIFTEYTSSITSSLPSTETKFLLEVTSSSSTIGDTDSNRTFPEWETTSFPSISSFLTTEPTQKMEASTFVSTSTIFETTTAFLTEETTAVTAIDCTKFETRCENGGTCIFIEQGHKCVCPFDSEGIYCEIKLGIRNAAFNGHSYLSHRLLNFTHISTEFEAKTMANNGLLFYANIDTTYMALYVESGYLKFKFSCGYQTMLLSELKVPVNTGYTMNIKAGLDFRKDMKHCDATIKVNDSLTMNGDQIAKLDTFLKPTAWLHLGGLPQELANAISPIGGFVGCLSNLKISNKSIKIYKDAEDGFEITECSSLACLSNPCHNGASCTSVEDVWYCHCKNGYLGKTCDISICDNNPCLFGGTCIPFTSSGYICLCPYGKHGHFCENDLKITEPYFSSTVRGLSSFVAYPFPDGISKNMELKFRFSPTTMEQISLLLFIGQNGHHDFYSDHIAVSFVKGYIMLTWNLGSGPRRIFTSQPIKKGARDYLVRLGHTGRRAWLYVEHLGNITGRSPGNLVKLDVVSLLFVGGHDSKNFSVLPHDLPLHTGFSGCIFDIEMKSGSVVIPFQGSMKTFGRAVGQCGTTECYDRSCQNGGACLHHGSTFMCLCQDGWFGPLCSSKTNLCDTNITKCADESRCVPLLYGYECDCPLGKIGTYCENDDNLTDVSLTGKRSFIALYPIELENTKFHIEIEIRILKDQGIVLFMGKKGSSFVCLSLLNGLLELRMQSRTTKIYSTTSLSVRSSKLLVKGVWHKVQLGIFGRKVYLSVDNIINTGILEMGHILGISKETIFIGGLPDMSEFPMSAAGSHPVHFTGCIRRLSVDDKSIPLTSSNIKMSRNLVDCDGTPCGGETCLHGGTCWLDSFMKPHCSCVQPYYGDTCESIPDCDENTCRNQGKCHDNRCSCDLGYTGAFCEREIIVRTPEFTGNSYLIVRKMRDKKRDLKDFNIRSLFLNFTTAQADGLLIWSQQEGNFLGVGLEKGYLKLSYCLNKYNKSVIEIPWYIQVSDGLWHRIEINFAPVHLKVDGKSLQTSMELGQNMNFSTDGVFFIGGIPTNKSLIEETNGSFSHPFKGCIEGFGSNADYITDVSNLPGSNINVCELFQGSE